MHRREDYRFVAVLHDDTAEAVAWKVFEYTFALVRVEYRVEFALRRRSVVRRAEVSEEHDAEVLVKVDHRRDAYLCEYVPVEVDVRIVRVFAVHESPRLIRICPVACDSGEHAFLALDAHERARKLARQSFPIGLSRRRNEEVGEEQVKKEQRREHDERKEYLYFCFNRHLNSSEAGKNMVCQ